MSPLKMNANARGTSVGALIVARPGGKLTPRGRCAAIREDICAPLVLWVEMTTLQGNLRRSAAKGIERGHLEGCRVARGACAPPRHTWNGNSKNEFEQHLFTRGSRR